MISKETRITIGNGFALVCGGAGSGIISYLHGAQTLTSFGMAVGGLTLIFVAWVVDISEKHDAKKSDNP